MPLSVTKSYEKICFVLNHSLDRHRVCYFLRTEAGNSFDFEHGHDHARRRDRQEDDREEDDDGQEDYRHHGSLAVSIRFAKESRDQEEG